MADLDLSDRWWCLGHAPDPAARLKRDAVGAELAAELAPGHDLHGRVDRIEATVDAGDDVVVRLSDRTFALVHPTWSRRRESPPFPTARPLANAQRASVAIREREQDL